MDGSLLKGPSAFPEIQFRLPAPMSGTSGPPVTPFPELSLQASALTYNLLTDTHVHMDYLHSQSAHRHTCAHIHIHTLITFF